MKTMPDIDNLIYRARHEAPCLVESELMRLILDLASALELCKDELSFSKDKLGAANKSLFGSKGESIPPRRRRQGIILLMMKMKKLGKKLKSLKLKRDAFQKFLKKRLRFQMTKSPRKRASQRSPKGSPAHIAVPMSKIRGNIEKQPRSMSTPQGLLNAP